MEPVFAVLSSHCFTVDSELVAEGEGPPWGLSLGLFTHAELGAAHPCIEYLSHRCTTGGELGAVTEGLFWSSCQGPLCVDHPTSVDTIGIHSGNPLTRPHNAPLSSMP